MPLRPIHETVQPPTYPQRGTRLARSLRSALLVAAGSLLSGALGCAATPPGVPIAPTIPAETVTDHPAPEEVEPSEVTEEWIDLPVQIWFLIHSDELDDSDRAMIREVRRGLENRTDILRIRVEGHVCLHRESEPGLALARANAAIDYMANDLGMRRDLFEAFDGGDGTLRSEVVNPDINQFTRVEFSILVRRER